MGHALMLHHLHDKRYHQPPESYNQMKHSACAFFYAVSHTHNECHQPQFLNMNALQWHHNEYDGISNHRRIDCLLNRLFRHRSDKTSKFRITDLCEGNSPLTCEFPAQKASNGEMFPFDDVIMDKILMAYIPWPMITPYHRLTTKLQ